jgi:hypothetical protein
LRWSTTPQGDILRARMDLVYGTEATSTFLSLLAEPADADALQLDVPFTNPQPTLKQAIIDTDANIAYDNFRHRLSSRGVFTTQRHHALRTLGAAPVGFKAAVDALCEPQ